MVRSVGSRWGAVCRCRCLVLPYHGQHPPFCALRVVYYVLSHVLLLVSPSLCVRSDAWPVHAAWKLWNACCALTILLLLLPPPPPPRLQWCLVCSPSPRCMRCARTRSTVQSARAGMSCRSSTTQHRPRCVGGWSSVCVWGGGACRVWGEGGGRHAEGVGVMQKQCNTALTCVSKGGERGGPCGCVGV